MWLICMKYEYEGMIDYLPPLSIEQNTEKIMKK